MRKNEPNKIERVIAVVGILMMSSAVILLCPRGDDFGWRDGTIVALAYFVSATATDAFATRWFGISKIIVAVAWAIIYIIGYHYFSL